MEAADDYILPTRVAGERIRIFHVPSKLIKPDICCVGVMYSGESDAV